MKMKEINKNFGSYKKEDCIFLLKDVSTLIKEQGNEEREKFIQSGVHYSEMIPIEYEPSKKYYDLFHQALQESKKDLALYTGIMSEKIWKKYGENTVLVSLARAGSPIGVLAKRYLKQFYNVDIPHYSISIIRDKGIDINAIKYILETHKDCKIQFVDGWTGKGTITNVLKDACDDLRINHNIDLDESLAVISDPSGFSSVYGTREDFLIPSACLNSIVSGLVSRTILRSDLIGPNDFHGAKFYDNLVEKDLSNFYVDEISACFESIKEEVDKTVIDWTIDEITKVGSKDVEFIQNEYNVQDVNFIKPGIGEATRVLLRRVPDKILVDDLNNPNLKHILVLAKEKNVEVEVVKLNAYSCCGIIKSMKDV